MTYLTKIWQLYNELAILEESNKPGCVIAEIARGYGIRKERIYTWRGRELKKSSKSDTLNNFVEAKLEGGDEHKNVLKKASLEFEKFTLSMEGSFKVNEMKQIMELLCST